jgi:archaellin
MKLLSLNKGKYGIAPATAIIIIIIIVVAAVASGAYVILGTGHGTGG